MLDRMVATDGIPDIDPWVDDGQWQVLDVIDIDPDLCSFLHDHRVDGVALVPVVLQLGVIATRLREVVGADAALRLSGVEVAAPLPARDGSPTTVSVLARRTAGVGWAVRLCSDGAVHLRAVVQAAADLDPGAGPGPPPAGERSSGAGSPAGYLPGAGSPVGYLPGTAAMVYPPMFHGPAFRVIDRFARSGPGLSAAPVIPYPSWDLTGDGGGSPTHLLELLLQTCGVWELAESGRMMRPSRIAEVLLAPPATARPGPATRARITPRWPAGPPPDDVGGTGAGVVFDGVVVEHTGRVLVRVVGYRPASLGTPPSPEVARRITSAIGPRRVAVPGDPLIVHS